MFPAHQIFWDWAENQHRSLQAYNLKTGLPDFRNLILKYFFHIKILKKIFAFIFITYILIPFQYLWTFGNLVGQFSDNVSVNICANFQPISKKSNTQEIFLILIFKVFRNDNFHASQVAKENEVVCTLTLLYIDVIYICKKQK